MEIRQFDLRKRNGELGQKSLKVFAKANSGKSPSFTLEIVHKYTGITSTSYWAFVRTDRLW